MSGTKTFLLELHCEEIPARFLAPLSEELARKLNHFVAEKLEYPIQHRGGTASDWPSDLFKPFPEGPNPSALFSYCYSPRKLAWLIEFLPTEQLDQTETQVGPPQRMCVGEDGKPTIQGEKFAEKWGLPFSAVRFEQPTGKKEPCAVVTITKLGRPTVDLLAEALPGLIAGLHVPKAMRWGKSDFEFVRPIRNILCLFGDQVVPITVDGVAATNTTWGHRLFHREHPEAVKIATPEAYEAALEDAGIVVSVDVRRSRIAQQLEALAAEVGGRVVADTELLDTLAEIVEFPMIVRGEFPADFLELPKEVLVTSLREHQKSFCIEQPDGTLLPFFLTAANRPDDPAGFVKAGNEWVLKARLYDARFFFAEDRKLPLSARLEKLKALTFHRELGSYFEKTERVVALIGRIAPRLNLNVDDAQEAARLAKADLRTLMVGEFPELQGVMGGEYLRHEGAHAEVWQAVKEHYRPVGADDAIPSTPMGCLLSLCDKLDTVVGCLKNGMYPTGSKDPLALRRAALGVVRIIWEQGWTLGLKELIPTAYQLVPVRGNMLAIIPPIPQEEGAPLQKTKWFEGPIEAIESFFKDRVAYQLELAGYAGSVRRSALAAGWGDLVDLSGRCQALQDLLNQNDPRLELLAANAKRIGNILKDENPSDEFDRTILIDKSEIDLAGLLQFAEEGFAGRRNFEEFQKTGQLKAPIAIQVAVVPGTPYENPYFSGAVHLAMLAEPLEAFFNSVMVKCEDSALRAARLSLLHRLRLAFLRVADFSQWQ